MLLSSAICLAAAPQADGQNRRSAARAIPMPAPVAQSAAEPIRYTGDLQPDKRFFDGNLPHVVGTHHIQVFRANRTDPSEPGHVGWTYNHQPYLAHWNGAFHLQFLSGLLQEHDPPTRLLHVTSTDGLTWSRPTVLFPPYLLPEIEFDGETIPAGTAAIMHQRMGFYVAPNGRLLASGFVGFAATPRRSPNAGNGLGRLIREIRADGTYGPIYFIRYNRHAGWDESNTTYPLYTSSDDPGFIEACEALLSDKIATLQWWEEDRGTDGFFAMDPSQVAGGDTFSARIVTSAGAGKAFAYYARPDGALVAMWKNRYSSISPDSGATWTPIVQNNTLLTTGAKTWGQQTDDGRYAIVHNHSPISRNRFPMAVLTGEDGNLFPGLHALTGEVPPRRYKGISKNPGLQYFRGIYPGNGNPPGDHMWVTYSVNKEDIWVSRTRTPIETSVTEEVDQNFESVEQAADLELWNLYSPVWAPITVERDPVDGNRYLQLTDEAPYNHAAVTRILPSAPRKRISFDFQAARIPQGQVVELELSDQSGNRMLRLAFDGRWLSMDFEADKIDPLDIDPAAWHRVELDIDASKGTYALSLDGRLYREDLPLNARTPADRVERLTLRTGPYRNRVPSVLVDYGVESQANFLSDDLPGSETKSPMVVFRLDNVTTQ